jgi:hypothetical protein
MSLRDKSIGAFVVDAASRNNFCDITALTQSIFWQPGDIDIVVKQLISSETLHIVQCRRGLEAALSGRHWTRGRTVMRSSILFTSLVNIITTSLQERDAHRLLEMGMSPWRLVKVILRTGPSWSSEFLHSQDTVVRVHRDEVLEHVKSTRVLPIMLSMGAITEEDVKAKYPDACNDGVFLEGIVNEILFMAPQCYQIPFVVEILYHVCRTGNLGQLVIMLNSPSARFYNKHKEKALELCQDADVEFIERVKKINTNDLRMYAVNYNALRIMSGLGGLSYSR